jgi:hypothetical protein
MAEEDLPLELWTRNIRPNGGQLIPAGSRVGRGQKSKGGFYSVDCYASFYEYEIIERARRISEATKKRGES